MTTAKKDRNLAILARRKEGGILQEIAHEFGLNVNTIMKICRAGEPYGFGSRDVPVERIAVKDQPRTKEIIALRRARKSLRAIGVVYGISRQRVWDILKAAGEPTDLPPWTPPNGKPPGPKATPGAAR